MNTKPLLYGIHRSAVMDDIVLTVDYPAKVAAQLLSGEIDLGLVPVAIIPSMSHYFIVSDYCIATEGEVASVGLFSDVPLEEITTVLLDYQSRTSVNLTKVLLKHFWQLSPDIVAATEGYQQEIKGTTAGVVIGDRAFEQRHVSTYYYDLGLAWKAFTGLPFVFAAWIANKELPSDFIEKFNAANAFGLQHIAAVVAENPYHKYDLSTYYTQNMSYVLTEDKRKGLNLFLSYFPEPL